MYLQRSPKFMLKESALDSIAAYFAFKYLEENGLAKREGLILIMALHEGEMHGKSMARYYGKDQADYYLMIHKLLRLGLLEHTGKIERQKKYVLTSKGMDMCKMFTDFIYDFKLKYGKNVGK